MRKLKLMTIVETRQEIIRLSAIIKRCDKYFGHVLALIKHNNDDEPDQAFFEDLGLRAPDFCIEASGEDTGETMGSIVSKTYRLMAEVKPDALMISGGANSCLSAIGAKRLRIPVFRLEASNSCFGGTLTEETNRRIVDAVADVNLCYSEHARRCLNAQGVPRERIYVTGSPMAEVLHANIDRIKSSDILEKLGLNKGEYILLSAHREENIGIDDNFFSLMSAVNTMAVKYDMPIVYSCHPRSGRLIEQRHFTFDRRVIRHRPFGFHDYNKLQMNAFAVVSDSETLPEESSFFLSTGNPIPAVCIRTSIEHPEALDKGSFILAGIKAEQVLQAIDMAVKMNAEGDLDLPVDDYTEKNASARVVKIIQGYAGIVNSMDLGKN
ncbi:MAG: UDP-N-acetyl glucosamine 2-epimerase [Acetivibrionales bacterium]|jgi:UDP-N-acetylglucosamine 2-epimerase